jgi:hypothetical protein
LLTNEAVLDVHPRAWIVSRNGMRSPGEADFAAAIRSLDAAHAAVDEGRFPAEAHSHGMYSPEWRSRAERSRAERSRGEHSPWMRCSADDERCCEPPNY